jgi:serine acetyltransferase
MGAMALVKGTVERWSMVVGVPARKIKNRCRNLLELEKRFLEEN